VGQASRTAPTASARQAHGGGWHVSATLLVDAFEARLVRSEANLRANPLISKSPTAQDACGADILSEMSGGAPPRDVWPFDDGLEVSTLGITAAGGGRDSLA